MANVRIRPLLLVCAPHPGHDAGLMDQLLALGYEVRRCADEETLIEAVSERRPRAIVYELRHQLPVDMAILTLLRRVLPSLPLVVLAGGAGEMAVRALRAVYSHVLVQEPVDRGALRAALRRAVARPRTRRVTPALVAI